MVFQFFLKNVGVGIFKRSREIVDDKIKPIYEIDLSDNLEYVSVSDIVKYTKMKIKEFEDVKQALEDKISWLNRINAYKFYSNSKGLYFNDSVVKILVEYPTYRDYMKGTITLKRDKIGRFEFSTIDNKFVVRYFERYKSYYQDYYKVLERCDGFNFAGIAGTKIEGVDYFFALREGNIIIHDSNLQTKNCIAIGKDEVIFSANSKKLEKYFRKHFDDIVKHAYIKVSKCPEWLKYIIEKERKNV